MQWGRMSLVAICIPVSGRQIMDGCNSLSLFQIIIRYFTFIKGRVQLVVSHAAANQFFNLAQAWVYSV
jgi:hypothetical protein